MSNWQSFTELERATVGIDHHGILWVKYKDQFTEMEVEHAEQQIAEVIRQAKGTPARILIDVRAVKFNTMSPEIMKYFAQHKELSKIRACQAIMVNTLGSRIQANFYVNIIKPGYPVKVFTNENKAIKWLLGFEI